MPVSLSVSLTALVVLFAFLVIFVYFFSRNHGTFYRKLTMNHHEINMYKECNDPHVRKLIGDFVEKHPFSVEELNKLSGKKLENYVEATEELLESIRKHVEQKSVS